MLKGQQWLYQRFEMNKYIGKIQNGILKQKGLLSFIKSKITYEC